MAAIKRALSRTQIDVERLKTIAMFCGVGLSFRCFWQKGLPICD
jgi:hypothetical protein